jgi:hypothetical protein
MPWTEQVGFVCLVKPGSSANIGIICLGECNRLRPNASSVTGTPLEPAKTTGSSRFFVSSRPRHF